MGPHYNFCMLNLGTTTYSIQVIQATAWATKVDSASWIKHGLQGTDLRTEEEEQHHLKPHQQRTTGKADSLFPLGYKAPRHSFHVGTVSHIQQRGCACADKPPL